MKLCFPGQEHLDRIIKDESLSVGAGKGCDIRLPSMASPSTEILFIEDDRGLVLEANGEGGKVEVNGNTIIAKAMLRAGDAIVADGQPINICASAEPLQMLPEGYSDMPYSDGQDNGSVPLAVKIGLRGLTGDMDGRLFGVKGETTLGNADSADVRVHSEQRYAARIFPSTSGIFLTVDENSAPVCVNGYEVQCASLEPGDQLRLGNDRFLLEAPGFVPVLKPTDSQTFVLHGLSKATAARENREPPVPTARRRDNWIIGICIAISASLLLLLAMRL